MSEGLLERLTRACMASPDEDGMILVTPELLNDSAELMERIKEASSGQWAAGLVPEEYIEGWSDALVFILVTPASPITTKEPQVTAGMVAYARAEIGRLARKEPDMRLDGLCDEEIEAILRAAIATTPARNTSKIGEG